MCVRLHLQAFSHFTLKSSNGQFVICDIQGVGHTFTDPQIHTMDGKGFGNGNMGEEGILKFARSHACNGVCSRLGFHEEVVRSSSQGSSSGTSRAVSPISSTHNSPTRAQSSRQGDSLNTSGSILPVKPGSLPSSTPRKASAEAGLENTRAPLVTKNVDGSHNVSFSSKDQDPLAAVPSRASALWKLGIKGTLSTLYSTITGQAGATEEQSRPSLRNLDNAVLVNGFARRISVAQAHSNARSGSAPRIGRSRSSEDIPAAVDRIAQRSPVKKMIQVCSMHRTEAILCVVDGEIG